MPDTPSLWLITGTGTDVGKTIVAAGLLRAVRGVGRRARIIKAVQTGCKRLPDGGWLAPDVEIYRQACPDAECDALHCFKDPCSPHLAAAREGGTLRVADIAEAVRALAGDADVAIVEGAGGLMVPLNGTETFADLLAELGGRIVVVAANGLGAINHTLLTLEALRGRGLAADAVVVNQLRPAADALEADINADNIAVLTGMGGAECLAALPCYARSGTDGFGEPDWNDIEQRLAPVVGHLLDSGATKKTSDTVAFDHEHLWHPYAPTTPPVPLWEAASTRGTTIRLRDGRELVDGMSSWWAAIHGYNHPRLIDALREQAALMPHVMFGGLTHRPAARLGEKLLRLAPDGLERVFYADSGSVAVEASLKMALQYQQAVGRTSKQRILTVRGGYHGDTFGAMSVCDPHNGMHRLFEGMLARQVFVERPSCRFDAPFEPHALTPLREAFAVHGGEIAAAIIEPVVQGAGGMWFYHPEYLRALRTLCDEHGVLLILDEIATGLGRTGRMFAAEWAGVAPDIMCVGKALTGGVMTLAAVLAGEAVAEAISSRGAFMHGPTFMANPLACAVACASLDLLLGSPWQERISLLETRLRDGLEPCRAMPGVADVRVLGGIGVVEMEREVNQQSLQRFFVDAGVWIRPFSTLIYVMPPYVADEADAAALTGAVRRAVEERAWL